MHTLKLNIQDIVFDKVIYFLQNLPKNEVLIVEDKVINESIKIDDENVLETKSISNHSANLIEDWKDDSEDDVWK